MEQDAIARCAIFDRVRLVRFREGARRGGGLSICDQRSGTIVEHGRLQRTLAQPWLWYNANAWGDSRVLQFVIRAELERVHHADICTKGLNAETREKARVSCGWPIQCWKTNGEPGNHWNAGFSAKQLSDAELS